MTETDIDKFYMVDLNFPLMLRVVSKGADTAHDEMNDRLMALCRSGNPTILTGYSGIGKSTIMLRTAVSWASGGDIALWISMDESAILSDAEATQFYQDVLSILPVGKRALLCLDNPALWQTAFSALGRNWPDDPRLRLLLTERSNRLLRITDPNADLLHHWFDGAAVAAMMFENQSNPLRIKDYPVEYIPETYQRKQKILERAVAVMFRLGVIRAVSQRDAVKQIMRDYNKASVSLVELIYRAQFWLKDFATRPENLRMDWDEWQRILKRELRLKGTAQTLYGVIALCAVFEVPITVSLFCRHFGVSEYALVEAMNTWRMKKNIEPILYQESSGTLLPKHDVASELFFLFHRDTLPVNELMMALLKTMDTFEIEEFLEKNTWKTPMQKGFKGPLKYLRYRDFLMTIHRRIPDLPYGLFSGARARLALGLLYTVPKRDRRMADQTLPLVAELDPGLDGSVLTASLYTEWGRLLADLNRKREAEEKFRAVIAADPRQIHSRTELGRLLAKQKGRESEAEQFLREAMQIDPKHIQSRVELGRLLVKRPGGEKDAERLFREAIRIDPQNLHPHTELGRLLAKQPGREREAEQFLKEILGLDSNNIQARTELGRLLAKQPGREKEAEQFLREAIRIEPDSIHSRTELGRLLAKQPGRESEAELFLRDTIKIKPEDIQSRTELGRLLAKQPGREDDAIAYLREAIRFDAKQIPPRNVLAELFIRMKKPQEARILYQEILSIKPNDTQAKNGLAKLM